MLWLVIFPSPRPLTLQNYAQLSYNDWPWKRKPTQRSAEKHLKTLSIRLSYFSSHSSEVKHMGLFRWFSSSALRGTACLLFRGSCRSSSSLSCGRQRCLKFKHCGNLHGNLYCNSLSPCHPEEALPKVEGKQLKCLQPTWHTVISPHLSPDRRGGDRACGFYCGGLAFFDILQWRGWKKEGVKSSFGCIARKPNIGNYLWFARS